MPELIDLDLVIKAKEEGAGAFKDAENGLGGIMHAGVALAATAGAAVAGFAIASIKHMEDTGQAAFDMSEKFGISQQQASQWSYIARSLGANTDDIGTGFRFLSKNMVDGSKKAKEAFDAIGVSARDSQGHLRNTNDVMLDVADKFQKMPDGARKAAIAIALFGREGTNMIPILNQGKTGLDQLIASGQKSGEIMSGAQVEAAHKLFLEQQQLSLAVQGVANQLGLALLPIATQFIDWAMNTAIPALQNFFGALGKDAGPAVSQFSGFIGQAKDVAQTVVDWFRANWPEIRGVVESVGRAVGAALNLVKLVIGSLLAAVKQFASEHRTQLNEVKKTVEQVVAAIAPLLDALAGFWKAHGDQIMGVVKVVWGVVVDVIQIALNVIRDLIFLVTDIIKGHWGAVWQDIKNLLGDVVGGIIHLIRDLVGGIFSILGTALHGIGDLAGSIGHAIWNGITGQLGHLGSWFSGVIHDMLSPLTEIPGVGGTIGGALHSMHIPGFASGGIVPGPIGAPQLILAHGGERVSSTAEQAGGSVDTDRIEQLLEGILEVLAAPPTASTGTEALVGALLSRVSRAQQRGMRAAPA